MLIVNDEESKQWRQSLNLKPDTLKTIREGLRQVVAGGTGAVVDVPDIPKASGKSGTAEVPPGEAHAWFGSYAPSNKPEIAIVAFCEHSGGGGKTAGLIVLEVMKAYFGKNKSTKPIKVEPINP